MLLLSKVSALFVIATLGSMASAATFNCKSVTGTSGGQVRLTTGGGLTQATFSLIKNGMTIGQVDFSAPPTLTILTNLEGEKVPFERYFDSIQSINMVITSTMSVEKSLLDGQSGAGLLIFKQQSPEQYVCQPATN